MTEIIRDLLCDIKFSENSVLKGYHIAFQEFGLCILSHLREPNVYISFRDEYIIIETSYCSFKLLNDSIIQDKQKFIAVVETVLKYRWE